MLKTSSNKNTKYRPNSLSDIWSDVVTKFADLQAIEDSYSNINLTYNEFLSIINDFATGIQTLGLNKGEHVALFSENSAKWMITDQGILKCGAVNAVRGSQAPIQELGYIYTHSDSCALVVENSSLIKDLDSHINGAGTKFAIYLFEDQPINREDFSYPIYSFEEVVEIGKGKDFQDVNIRSYDLATIVYSSGTTGKPKGIMLTHGNLLSQIKHLPKAVKAKPGKTVLNVLPIWHTYERTCEYFLMTQGCKMAYTNLRNFKKDLLKVKPHYLIAVPRLWEAIYDGVIKNIKAQPASKQKIFNFLLDSSIQYKKSQRIINNRCVNNQNTTKLLKISQMAKAITLKPIHDLANQALYTKIKDAFGGRLEFSVSGGGALAKHIDDFLDAIDVNIIVGYGLTETSPVLTVRKQWHNEIYSAGQLIDETEIMIVDPETKAPLALGQKGLVLAKGPQVMRGYYKDTEATTKVINPQGWFNTGDLGWMTKSGSIVLTGRLKDTIVLSNGENIEPDCIEQACLKSPFVKQIVLVGQDKSSLGALIAPDNEAITNWAKVQNMSSNNYEEIVSHPKFHKTLSKELTSHIQSRPNFRPFERVTCFRILDHEFSVDNGLMTQTAKIKKNEVTKRYATVIDEMFGH